jgi:hypothetical protein
MRGSVTVITLDINTLIYFESVDGLEDYIKDELIKKKQTN